jgi:hypothetical protein
MIDQIIEILDRNQEKFTGSNEANLHSAEEIEKMFGWKKFPENKPRKMDRYICYSVRRDEYFLASWSGSDWRHAYTLKVDYWMPIIEYKP